MKKKIILMVVAIMMFAFASTALASTWTTNGCVVKGGPSQHIGPYQDAISSKYTATIQQVGWVPNSSIGPIQIRARLHYFTDTAVTHIMEFSGATTVSSAYLVRDGFFTYGSLKNSSSTSNYGTWRGYVVS